MKTSNYTIQRDAMTKAWEIFRANGERTMKAWSSALKTAWALVKAEREAMIIAEEEGFVTEGYQEYWYRFQFNHWMKAGHNRVYLNLNYGRARSWSRGVSYCIDLNSGNISDVSRKYNNTHENQVVGWIAERVAEYFA